MKILSLLTVLTFLLIGCSSHQPYEEPIVKYFETEQKVVPIINEITVDSTANMASYSDYWKKRIEDLKVDIKKTYKDDYLMYKGYYDERIKLNKGSGRRKNEDPFNSATMLRFMTEYKNKLDSAENGLYDKSYTQIVDLWKKLSEEKSTLQVLTVKYKLNEAGTVMIQKFVVEELENDTTAYPLNQPFFDFIQKSGFRR